MWKQLDDRYDISSEGDVFDKKLKAHPKKCLSNFGYHRVSIHGKMTALHRLVAKLFIPNPENKPNINHLDKNKLNNDVSNLEWCTQSENILHSYRSGKTSKRAKTTPDQLDFIVKSLDSNSLKPKQLAEMFNVKITTIYAIKQGYNRKRLI